MDLVIIDDLEYIVPSDHQYWYLVSQ